MESFSFSFMKDIKELLNFGLINFDKPAGPTSYSVSEFVQRQLKLKKTSHMGTLDPKVTGVLPVTLGRACKLAGYFIKHDKTYVGILETHKECKLEDLQKLIDDNFVGKILQTPPHRSAVKREERERVVYSWKLIEASDDNRSFLFEAKVEGGTEIRKVLPYVDVDKSALKSLHIGRPLFTNNVIVRDGGLVVWWFGGLAGKELKEGDFFSAFCEDEFVGVYRKSGEEIVFGRSEF